MLATGVIVIPLALSGCGGESSTPRSGSSAVQKPSTPETANATAKAESSPADAAVDEVAAERAKLSKEDRALVDAQEWCVVNTEGRLGSMGAPIKLTIKGQTVFLCCAGCKRKAESNPDKTLATLEDLKRKAKAAKSKTG